MNENSFEGKNKLTQSLSRLSKSQEGDFPKKANILGLDIVIYENVFSPVDFADAEVFTPMIEKYMKKNVNFLELGSGAGVTSVYASKKGCEVTATDINPSAVENTRENAKNNNVSIDVRLGDLFKPVENEKFDVIYWNIPFMKSEVEPSTDLEKSILDKDDMLKQKLLNEFPQYLKKEGVLLIGYSPNFCKFDFKKVFSEAGYVVQRVGSETKSFDSLPEGITLEVIEIKNNL